MSRIELDRYDRLRVEQLRADLAASEAESVGGLDASQLCKRIGHMEAIAGLLLQVLDQEMVSGE